MGSAPAWPVAYRVPRRPRDRGGEAEGARQKEVVAVISWPEAQTSSLRGGGENRRCATALGTEQVVSLIPGSVGYYISHTHCAYDYLGPFGLLWVHMA